MKQKSHFEYGQEVAFAQAFAEPDPENPQAMGVTGGVLVFAPNDWKGSSAPKDKNKGNFTYVEFDKNLKLTTRGIIHLSFSGMGNEWV